MSQSPTSSAYGSDTYLAGWTRILELVNTGGTWSGHERNCCFLNTGGGPFADVSAATGLDFLDDGRCVAPVDWDFDGDLDLWLSARTGPRLRFVRNDLRHAGEPGRGDHFLAVKLVGRSCNRDAIGARLELTAGGVTLIRTLFAGDGYLTQSSKWVHFGLGANTNIERLRVRWPGGEAEEFAGLGADGWFELVQGRGRAAPWQPPPRKIDWQPSRIETRQEPVPARLVLRDRIPLPRLEYQDFDDRPAALPDDVRGPLLINLWATWCVPCLKELQDLTQAEAALRDSGLEIVALSVNGLGDGDTTDMSEARQYLQQHPFPFSSGAAHRELLDKLDALQDVFVSLRAAGGLQLPSSFLIDEHGRLAVIYRGALDVDRLLADVQLLGAAPVEAAGAAFPFAGRWYAPPHAAGELLIRLAQKLEKRNNAADAMRYARLAADLATRDPIPPQLSSELAALFFAAGEASLRQKSLNEAQRHFREAVQLRPDWAEAHTNLGHVFSQLGAREAAENHYQMALQFKPTLLQANFNLGVIRLDQGHYAQAAAHFQAIVEANPEFPDGHYFLGLALARLGRRVDAVRHLETALRLDPDHADAQRQLDAVLSGPMP